MLQLRRSWFSISHEQRNLTRGRRCPNGSYNFHSNVPWKRGTVARPAPGIVGRVTSGNFCGTEQYVALAYCAGHRGRSVMRHDDIVIDAGPISIPRKGETATNRCRRRASPVHFCPDRESLSWQVSWQRDRDA